MSLKGRRDLGMRARYGRPASIPGGDRGISVVCARRGGGDDQWVRLSVTGEASDARDEER